MLEKRGLTSRVRGVRQTRSSGQALQSNSKMLHVLSFLPSRYFPVEHGSETQRIPLHPISVHFPPTIRWLREGELPRVNDKPKQLPFEGFLK